MGLTSLFFSMLNWQMPTKFKRNDKTTYTLNVTLINTGTLYITSHTVYPKKYAHGFVVLCFVVVMQSFIMNSHEVFIHINQGCFVRLPQCQWSKPDGYGKISQCITTTKHSKAKTVCIFLGIYCTRVQYIVQFHRYVRFQLPFQFAQA